MNSKSAQIEKMSQRAPANGRVFSDNSLKFQNIREKSWMKLKYFLKSLNLTLLKYSTTYNYPEIINFFKIWNYDDYLIIKKGLTDFNCSTDMALGSVWASLFLEQ